MSKFVRSSNLFASVFSPISLKYLTWDIRSSCILDIAPVILSFDAMNILAGKILISFIFLIIFPFFGLNSSISSISLPKKWM